jgi:tetratricopeptide (TPR) repeat protein
MTEAEKRSAAIKQKKREVFAAREASPSTPKRIPPPPVQRTRRGAPEQWQDEGPLRDEASNAIERSQAATVSRSSAGQGSSSTAERFVDPEVAQELTDAVGALRSQRLMDRLTAANLALDRERFDEARRLVAPLLRELPSVAAVHETSGLVNYRLGRWKQAAKSLEVAQGLRESMDLLPVLADCYRALRQWSDVDRVWRKVKAASPSQEVMTEARIVVAGSLADRGEIRSAISLLTPQGRPPKRLRDHHLRQWYALGDLCDRAGDTIAAHRWFSVIAQQAPDFVDVRDRIRALGR